MSNTAKTIITVLFILVLLSIGLNVFILMQLREARQAARQTIPELQAALSQTAADLEALEQSNLELSIDIVQEFPIETEIPFNETIEVPIQLTVPISQVIETTVVLNIVGGIELPVDIAVPVDVEVPINNTVVIPIDRTIPISTVIPLDVTVPVAIDVGETELAGFVTKLREGIVSLNEMLDRFVQ
ncbi:MAG: hypothetical protein R3264_01080 [Anaerolineae bacterium]|nr:hypothetical protein [Anaerolineae bacterium]